MKIAIVRKECSFRKGGAERYAANLCTSLARAGHEVLLLAETCDEELLCSVTHIPVKVNRLTSASRNWSFHANSARLLAGIAPDRVLALSRAFPADGFRVSDPLHGFWMKVRYPGAAHRFLQSLNPRHRTILRLEKGIFDPANTGVIITNSALSKRMIPDYHDFPADRIEVVYNGVDTNQFRPLEEPPPFGATTELLFVGQDFRRKGLGPLIHALARLEKAGADCRLRVVGRDDPAPYIRLATELGIERLVRFDAPFRNIESAYQSAHLLVFPTLYDPFANVCLEALACGLPVLTTTTNGASEILTEGEDGYVVDGDEEGLAHALVPKIESFLNLTPAERESMRRKAAGTAAAYDIDGNSRGVVAALSRAPRLN